jgi:transcriptional regulator with XRE-family HTH domain
MESWRIMTSDNSLGIFLKHRRTRLNPAALGFELARRRTPGLRREEVALRANVSATWYTWLEQGRGGQPSSDALSRIADALLLQPAEREHLFILANQRPQQQCYPAHNRISPRVKRVLDSLEASPAYVKNAMAELIAWNRAAAIVLDDQIDAASRGLNLLQYFFCDPRAPRRTPDWEDDARFAVAAFRLCAARSGHNERIARLVDELCHSSETFESLWANKDVVTPGEGNRRIRHPTAGTVDLEYSTFSLDGQPNLTMVIYTPASESDLLRVRSLLESTAALDVA